jgi:hypothetical protein
MKKTSRFTAVHAWAFCLLAFLAPVTPLAAALSEGDILFSQAPEAVDSGYLSFYSSATEADGDEWLAADDFSGLTADIADIHWYGFMFNWNAWAGVDPAGTLFQITFYEDDSGSPGSVVAQFSDIEPAYEAYDVIYLGDTYRFDFDLPAPVSLAAGWVSIQSTYSPNGGSFAWRNSAEGTLNGVHSKNGGEFYYIFSMERPYGDNVAFTLTSRPSDQVIPSMAAPNIAEIILEAEGVNPQQSIGKGKNRVFINLIQETADFMGPGTDFDGVPKYILVGDPGEEIQSLNPEYWQAVLDFLNARIAYYGLGIGTLTYSFDDYVYGGEPEAIFAEDFTSSLQLDIPVGWGETAAYPNWFVYAAANAGGISPEMAFYWGPVFTGVSRLVTPEIDAGGFTGLELTFKHFVNDYSGGYTLKVQVSTDNGVTWTDAWSINPSGYIGPETVTVDLSAYDGQTFQLAWLFDGWSYAINWWFIDDVLVTGG